MRFNKTLLKRGSIAGYEIFKRAPLRWVAMFTFLPNGKWCPYWWSSLIYNRSARHEQHECDKSNTNAARVRHKCDASATLKTRVRHEWRFLILITTRVKTYFHTLIFTIWRLKDYKERSNFMLRITFWKCLFSMLKCIQKVHHKN